MNSATQHETDKIMAGHLGHLPPVCASSPPAAAHRADIDALVADLTLGLQDLLGRYVASLELADHGGWSLEDDEMVLRIRSLLERAGCHAFETQ